MKVIRGINKGSGIIVRINGHIYVATIQHVLADTSSTDVSLQTVWNAGSPPATVPSTSIISDPNIDIAVISLSYIHHTIPSHIGYNLMRQDIRGLQGRTAHVYGVDTDVDAILTQSGYVNLAYQPYFELNIQGRAVQHGSAVLIDDKVIGLVKCGKRKVYQSSLAKFSGVFTECVDVNAVIDLARGNFSPSICT